VEFKKGLPFAPKTSAPKFVDPSDVDFAICRYPPTIVPCPSHTRERATRKREGIKLRLWLGHVPDVRTHDRLEELDPLLVTDLKCFFGSQVMHTS
jgi:hypothetical protein